MEMTNQKRNEKVSIAISQHAFCSCVWLLQLL